MVFIGYLSFPTWPFHPRSNSRFSLSIESFIESMAAYLKIKKGHRLGWPVIAIYQLQPLASGSRKHKWLSTISESISQTAGNRDNVDVKFSLSLASSGNPYYDTLSIHRD